MAEVGFAHHRTEKSNIKATLKPVQAFGRALGIFPDFQKKGVFKITLLLFYAFFVVSATFYIMLYRIVRNASGTSQKSEENSLNSYISHANIVNGLMASNYILFLRLSLTWPSLTDKWLRIDANLFNKGLYDYPWKVNWACPAIILFNILILVGQAVIAYIMVYSKLSSILGNNRTMEFAHLAHATYPQLSGLMAFLWYPANICVYWTVVGHLLLAIAFFESFVMVVSLNLASRLKHITSFAKAIVTSNVSHQPKQFWINIRRDYSRVTNLIASVDDQICLITLCSYVRCLMFLLTMLSSFLARLTTPAEKWYCFYSGFHYLTKLILLTLFSSWINEESTNVLRVLNSISSEEYSKEVARFLLQISFDDVALTGCKMFKLKKSLILKVINAVVTYELIVIQYLYSST